MSAAAKRALPPKWADLHQQFQHRIKKRKRAPTLRSPVQAGCACTATLVCTLRLAQYGLPGISTFHVRSIKAELAHDGLGVLPVLFKAVVQLTAA